VAANLEDLQGQQFDIITLHHVLEHLAGPAEVLMRVCSLMSSSGRVFIEVPHIHSLRAKLATDFVRKHQPGVDERYRAFPIHLMYHSKRGLAKVLADGGFDALALDTTGMGLDEFVCPKSASASPGRAAMGRANAQGFSIRHAIRDTFLGMGLGENLAAVAVSRR
jgi:hypothetical protein